MDGVVCQTDIFTNKCSSCNWNERSGCHIGLHSLRDPGIWWTAFGYKWVAVVAADKSHWNWFNDVQIRPYSYKLSPIYSCQGNAPKTTRSSSSPALSIVLCCRHGHPGRRQSSSSKNGKLYIFQCGFCSTMTRPNTLRCKQSLSAEISKSPILINLSRKDIYS